MNGILLRLWLAQRTADCRYSFIFTTMSFSLVAELSMLPPLHWYSRAATLLLGCIGGLSLGSFMISTNRTPLLAAQSALCRATIIGAASAATVAIVAAALHLEGAASIAGALGCVSSAIAYFTLRR